MVYYFDNVPPIPADPAAKARFPPGLRTREGYGWYLSWVRCQHSAPWFPPAGSAFSFSISPYTTFGNSPWN
jgi:hypothetical protein